MYQNDASMDAAVTNMMEPVYGESHSPSPTPRLDWMLSATILYSVMFAFITLSFKGFFYFAPNANASDMMPFLLVMYLLGWPVLIVVPPLLVLRRNLNGGYWTRWSSVFFLAGVLLWPVVVEAIKLRSIAINGSTSLDYWGTYPIFILLEILWPIANVVVWFIQVRNQNPEYRFKREIRERAREEMRLQLQAQSARYSGR